MDIKDFLLARIAEDEAVARAAAGSINEYANRYAAREYQYDEPLGEVWQATDYGMVRGENLDLWDCEGSDTLCTTAQAATHIARYDPARMLRECAAKREIIRAHQVFVNLADTKGSLVSVLDAAGAAKGLGVAMRSLCIGYSDHPDYQQEWAA